MNIKEASELRRRASHFLFWVLPANKFVLLLPEETSLFLSEVGQLHPDFVSHSLTCKIMKEKLLSSFIRTSVGNPKLKKRLNNFFHLDFPTDFTKEVSKEAGKRSQRE